MIISIIKERLAQHDCENGFILDGVPRTVAQAEALEEMGVEIDQVVDIEVTDDTIIKRLSGPPGLRLPAGRATTPLTNPASSPMCATGAAAPLIVRKDDEPATILERLAGLPRAHRAAGGVLPPARQAGGGGRTGRSGRYHGSAAVQKLEEASK